MEPLIPCFSNNVLKHWILVSQRCGLRYARYKVRRERKECCWCSLTAVVLNFGFPFLCSGDEQAVDLFQQEVRRCYDSCAHLRHVGTGHRRHTVWADEARAMAGKEYSNFFSKYLILWSRERHCYWCENRRKANGLCNFLAPFARVFKGVFCHSGQT